MKMIRTTLPPRTGRHIRAAARRAGIRGILLSGAFLFLLAFPAAAQTESIAVLEYFEFPNQVQIVDSDGFQVSETYFGMVLGKGDYIITGAGSAEIRLTKSGSIIKLAPHTKFRIDSLEGVQGDTDNIFTLAEGELRTITSTTAEGEYEIHTPSAVGGANGADFAVSVIAGSLEALAVQEGKVPFTKNSGETIIIEEGKAADVFAEVFQPEVFSPEEIERIFYDMNFTILDPELVIRAAPEPEPVVQDSVPPAAADPAPEPGWDKVVQFFRDHTALDMEFGITTIDKESYARIIFQPKLTVGGLKAALYLPLVYTNNLANEHPLGNDEWNFGAHKNWSTRYSRGLQDFLRDLVLKIYYIEYGGPQDSFFLRAGAMDGISLGHGILMYKYANTSDFPAARRVGVYTKIDADFLAFEALTTDLAEPEIFGGRLALYPVPSLPLGIGFSAALDRYPARGAPETLSFGLPDDPRDVDPMLLGIAVDIDISLIKDESAALNFFTDAATIFPYLRYEYAANGLGGKGIQTDAFFDADSAAKFRNYGLMAGFTGKLDILDYRIDYRQSRGIFRPGFFGPAYDRIRGLASAQLLSFLRNPDAPEYNTPIIGFYGEAGLTFFEKLRLEAGYLWSFKSDRVRFPSSDDDYLEFKIVFMKGLIPVTPFNRFYLSLLYNRRMFVPSLTGRKHTEFFDANALLRGELTYSVTDEVDIAFSLTTTTLRDTNGYILYDSDGLPKWVYAFGLETRIRL
jgi:hypothetical protein